MTKSIYSKDYREIIHRLKKSRIAAGFTQKEAAKRFDKPQSFISKIESGERRLDISELKRLTVLYEADVKHILGQ